MVLSLITLAATVPLLATSTVQLSDQAEKTSEHGEEEIKTRKCHFSVRASRRMSDKRRQELADMVIVLREGRLFLDHPKDTHYHPFTGYFLPYPKKSYDGLVTTINNENLLNWVYIESSTQLVKHGVRSEAQSQLTGPMGLKFSINGEKRLTFEGWEGFVVVEEEQGQWALYFDRDDNGLRNRVNGQHVVEVELIRMELDHYRPTETRQTIDEPD
jgi:hypothetical protein